MTFPENGSVDYNYAFLTMVNTLRVWQTAPFDHVYKLQYTIHFQHFSQLLPVRIKASCLWYRQFTTCDNVSKGEATKNGPVQIKQHPYIVKIEEWIKNMGYFYQLQTKEHKGYHLGTFGGKTYCFWGFKRGSRIHQPNICSL